MMELRPYQQDLIKHMRTKLIEGKRKVCVVLGCGGGKSIIQAKIAHDTTKKGNRVLFLVHRLELCEQIRNTFISQGVNMELCTIGMVQTIHKRLDKQLEPQVILCDEAHHIMAKTYMDILAKFPDAISLGFTATPIRLDGKGLGAAYEELVEGVSTRWLIDNKYLADYELFGIKFVDTRKIKTVRGEFSQGQVAHAMESRQIYGDTVKNYIKIAGGKKTIVYCASVEASKRTRDEFNVNGISSAHLDANSTPSERKEVMDAFRDGRIKVLCNVDLFGEGLDVKDCECVIMLRPTKSLSLYIQQSMRCMRYVDGKKAFIIDHVENAYRHGLPDDDRRWLLVGKIKQEVEIKQCPHCCCMLRAKVMECPECGYVFGADEEEEEVDRSRKKLETVEATLTQITRRDILASKGHGHYKNIGSFENMVEFQEVKGYKFVWVIHKCLELKLDIPNKYMKTVEYCKSQYKEE